MSPLYEGGRFELKYVLPAACRADVLRLTQPHVQPDPHAVELPNGRRGYFVRSLYLDTSDLADYFDRLDRKRVRNRLRVRTYGQPQQKQPVFIEVKRKSGPWVIKHRAAVGDADEWCRCPAARPWVTFASRVEGRGRYAASAFLQLVEGAERSPVSLVHYEREVFVPLEKDSRRVRLTLDTHVAASSVSSARDLFAPATIDLIPPDWLVMELKFERFAPAWMTRLRRELGVTAVPVSKFGLSVAQVLRPAYPDELHALLPAPILQRRRAA
ncbi:MAG: polyphosphate polymerase domain-containing protein [Acidobacteria bacterium]|nr:polyphosphate polymerase domain-containing protein [Acidobacteriota bacterium]